MTIPLTKDGLPLSKMAVTKGEAKRERIAGMYRNDLRCAPWTGTAFGVVQTFNTYSHHEKPTRGQTVRAERNMMSALDGTIEKETEFILDAMALAGVFA